MILDYDGDFEWVVVDEKVVCGFCYMLGIIGNLKGVFYLYCLNVLYILVVNGVDVMGMCVVDSVFLVVFMFYVNVWIIVFSVFVVGFKLVMLGVNMDGESIYELFENE